MEEWIRWAVPILLSYIAWEIRHFRMDVAAKVSHSECNRHMEEHKKRIDDMNSEKEKLKLALVNKHPDLVEYLK